MHKYILLAIGLFCSNIFFAQKHDYNWMFGYDNNNPGNMWGGVNVDFNYSPPKYYQQLKKIDFGFYSAFCSDTTGKLLFYTNGISIRDVSHNKMMNGDTINPGEAWLEYQSDSYPNGPYCFAIPAPGLPNHYYLFHMGTTISPSIATTPFYYSLIDMQANNGLGSVIKKNQIISAVSDHAAPVGVKHGNGRDWWIITGELSTKKIISFLVDPAGVHGPFITQIPAIFSGNEYQSQNAISPDGHTYVRCDGVHGLEIFDFDRCTGVFSNERLVPFGSNVFGFATIFAPDSRHLYISSWEYVMQIDIGVQNISATFDTIAYFDGTGYFTPGLLPDNKIYYASFGSSRSLHVIHNPDLPGNAADLEQHGVVLPRFNNGTMGLFPNYRLGKLLGSQCDTINFKSTNSVLNKLSNTQPETYLIPKDNYIWLKPLGGLSANDMVPPPRISEFLLKQKKTTEKHESTEKKN